MKIYAFDVDETLEVSAGPVLLSSLIDLRAQGHVVGLCGNWAVFCQRVPGWPRLISFMNVAVAKEAFLIQLRHYIPAEDYVLVGNILDVSDTSDDQGTATRAGWRFIQETAFARGVR